MDKEIYIKNVLVAKLKIVVDKVFQILENFDVIAELEI